MEMDKAFYVKVQNQIKEANKILGIGIGWKVATSGEKVILSVLKQHISPPYCVFDVGSNIGQFLNLILNNLQDIQIHCFEPNPLSFNKLTKTVANLDTNEIIKLNNKAISSNKGYSSLFYDKDCSELSSLTKRRLDHFNIFMNKEETVCIDTIDSYCDINNITRINLLKLDIEGYELDALCGASNMFENKLIDMVTFEFGGCNIDTRTFFQDYWYFFKEIKFKLFRITQTNYLHHVDTYRELDEQFVTTNFIAIKDI